MNYRIIVDSSSNLSGLPGAAFASVPLKIITDEKEFLDDANLDTAAMLAYLTAYKGRSGTSCPNVGDWLEAFGDAEGVFVVSITSNLSGGYNAAMQAKAVYEDTHPGRRVCCLDTLSTGPEMGLLAEKLRELIGSGLPFDEIEGQIREYMQFTHLLFSLESLNNMSKNGRVNPVVAKACGLLGIRIVGKASDQGTLQAVHKVRGEKKAISALMEEMLAHGYCGGKVRIDHCFNEVAALALIDLIRGQFPEASIALNPTAGLCSFYAEKGGLMVGFEG